MYLSKQEFNKLSKKEKARIASGKSPLPRTKQAKKKRSLKNNGNVGRQTKAAPIAVATSLTTRAPKVSMNRDQCRIQHAELISSIVGTQSFNASSLSINPGIQATFPWLSIIAGAWEEYEFHSLKFCYYTRTGTTSAGSFNMAIDYDAADALPASEQVMSTYQGAIGDAPWKNITCVARKGIMSGPQRRHYLRNGPLATNLDIKTYDVGNFIYATIDALADDTPWGKLWVEYDVSLYVPQLPPSGAAPYGGSITSGGGSISPSLPFGASPNVNGSSLGISMNGTNNTITFSNLGSYVLGFQFEGTDLGAAAPVFGPGVEVISNDAVIDSDATTISAYANIVVNTLGVNVATYRQACVGTELTTAGCNIGQAPNGSLD